MFQSKAFKIGFLIAVLVFIALSIFIQCGTKKDAPTLTGTCKDGTSVGETKTAQCADGTPGAIVYTCQTPDTDPVKTSDTCNSKPVVIGYNDVETKVRADQLKFGSNDQPFIRWADASNKASKNAKQAVDKALNSVSTIKGSISLTTETEPGSNIFRIDLRDFGLSREDWFRIENADKLNFESFTGTGRLLKTLAVTRKPVINADNLVDIMLFNSALYYQLVRIDEKKDLNVLRNQLGVNFAGDLANLDAFFIGTTNSTITNNKNRLIVKLRAGVGSFFETFDVKPIVDNTQNLFLNPFLKETGSKRIFNFAASEEIVDLPNGLHKYSLSLANNQVIEAADIDVVRDTSVAANGSPVGDGVIRVGGTCMRCHNGGYIPSIDEVLASGNSELNPDDLQRLHKLYHTADQNAQLFKDSNAPYLGALIQMNIDPTGADPVNSERDIFRLNYDITKTAAFFHLSEDELKQQIDAHARVRALLSQLLSGGNATFDQIVQAVPFALEDFENYLRDPL